MCIIRAFQICIQVRDSKDFVASNLSSLAIENDEVFLQIKMTKLPYMRAVEVM